MAVHVGALKEWRKKKNDERQAERLRDAERESELQFRKHLNAAVKLYGAGGDVKRRQPLDVLDLPLQRQVDLLEQYAERLTDEIEDFKEEWGEEGGKRGLSWLETERSSVLVSLAKVKIKLLKGERND